MALQLKTAIETSQLIVDLVNRARREVVLVSPYLTLGRDDHVGRAVRDALRRKVAVRLYFREDDRTAPKQHDIETISTLVELGLRAHVVPSLHAKIYLSESAAVVTSLNLLETSLRNIEFGIHVTEPQDVAEVRRFFEKEIQRTGRPYQDVQSRRAPPRDEGPPMFDKAHSRRAPPREEGPAMFVDAGHCIRCGDEIPYDTERPLCTADYRTWREYGDPDYAEHFCHQCGEKRRTSMRRPLCRECDDDGMPPF